ncbi:MAG: DUF1801 domain-containing protein [Blastomonas sp.]
MAKAELKTRENDASVAAFIAGVDSEVRRADAQTLLELFGRVTGLPPRMWGPSIIGFGSYHYKYDSGREGEMCRAGFSPRKANMVLYLIAAYCDEDAAREQERLLAGLGKYKTGKSCLYVNRLDQVDMAVLEKLVANNWAEMNRRYPD